MINSNMEEVPVRVAVRVSRAMASLDHYFCSQIESICIHDVPTF